MSNADAWCLIDCTDSDSDFGSQYVSEHSADSLESWATQTVEYKGDSSFNDTSCSQFETNESVIKSLPFSTKSARPTTANRFSLLSREHREYYSNNNLPIELADIKIDLLAFDRQTSKKYESYPKRLKSQVLQCRHYNMVVCASTQTPEYTPVTSFKKDQAIQINLPSNITSIGRTYNSAKLSSGSFKGLSSNNFIETTDLESAFASCRYHSNRKSMLHNLPTSITRTSTLHTQAYHLNSDCVPINNLDSREKFLDMLQRNYNLQKKLHQKSQQVEQLWHNKLQELKRILPENNYLNNVYQQTNECKFMNHKFSRESLHAKINGYQDFLTTSITMLKSDITAINNTQTHSNSMDMSQIVATELQELLQSLENRQNNISALLHDKYFQVPQQTHKMEKICLICQKQIATVKLAPCGHRIICSMCAIDIDTCPMDDYNIQDKVLTYGYNAYF